MEKQAMYCMNMKNSNTILTYKTTKYENNK